MKLGKYKHFKGSYHKVIGIARHSENPEQELVVYTHEEEGEYPAVQMWVRPKEMFLEKIERDGVLIERFKYVDEE